MNEFDFARAFLPDFAVKGDEIVPKYCPICHGGDHTDKYSFALNYKNHTYNCKRGSCNAKGHFSQLCKMFGVEMDREEKYTAPQTKKKYKRPEKELVPATDVCQKYLTLRGIEKRTAEAFGISSADGNLAFPYYRTAEEFELREATFVKYRKAGKVTKGERKMWREADTEPILFGMHLCDEHDPVLYLFEGEFDAMCGWQATGKNCVSVPSGCEDFTWLETCHEWLERFETIGVFADNDDAGRKMLAQLGRKLDCKLLQPDFGLYGFCKDANEILHRMGLEAVKTVMEQMKPVGVQGLLNLADVENTDMSSIPRTFTGMDTLDKATGGLFDGDLSVWTGKRGEGKSTFLTQTLLYAVEDGRKVCIYSGEIPADRLKYGINLQAAGSGVVQTRLDQRSGRRISYVPRTDLEKIEAWYNGKIWVYDNRCAETDESEAILKLFELAYKRYDCRVFLVDNLMTVNSTRSDRDFYQLQADFTIKLRKLAERLGVHIHLVVHPRKTDGEIKDSDSVGGLGTITNIACNVFNVHRCTEAEQKANECDATVRCLKNRAYGELVNIRLMYNPDSKRFHEPGKLEKRFSWEDQVIYTTKWGEAPF